jgi:hypothetical protein
MRTTQANTWIHVIKSESDYEDPSTTSDGNFGTPTEDKSAQVLISQ